MKHTKCERTHEQPTKYVAISIQVTIIKNVSGDIPLLLQELKHALGSLTMHTGRQTKDRQIDTHTDRQADKQAHRQTDAQTGTHTQTDIIPSRRIWRFIRCHYAAIGGPGRSHGTCKTKDLQVVVGLHR